MRLGTACGTILPLLAGTLAAAAAPDGPPFPPQALPVVPVFVDGTGPYAFLLDTGSTASLLAPRLAASLALPLVDRRRLEGPNGTRIVARVRARLRAADYERADETLLVVPIPAAPGLAVEGVLGLGFLEGVDVEIDAATGRVRLAEGCRARPGDEGPAVAVERTPLGLVVAAEGPRGRRLRLVLDTGASDLVLFGGADLVSGRSGEGRLETIHGAVSVRRGTVDELRIGPHRLGPLPVAVLSRVPPAAAALGVDGLLAAGVFERVRLCLSRGTVRFGPPAPGLRAAEPDG